MTTEREVIDALHQRYGTASQGSDGRRYVCAEHVKNALSFGATRIADFIAIDCWASSARVGDRRVANGYSRKDTHITRPDPFNEIHGFEIKVSRSDWLAELRAPEKSEHWKQRCHRWWLVAPEGVVRNDLPDGWGLLTYAVHGAALRSSWPAPIRRAVPWSPPEHIAFARQVQKVSSRRAYQLARQEHLVTAEATA